MDYIENYNAAEDLPDLRDIPARSLLSLSTSLPSRVVFDNTKPLDQGRLGACTVFGTSGALFETSFQDAAQNGAEYVQPYDPLVVWEKAKTRGASDLKGWILQGALTLINDLKHSVGYALVAGPNNTDPTPLKQALASRYVITTGSAHGDWSKILTTGVYSSKETRSGHIFQLNGYDDEIVLSTGQKGAFHSPNSWGGRGSFWIPYSMIRVLYSSYIQLDPSDAEKLKDYKNTLAQGLAARAKDRGLWNGERGGEIASAEEIRIMLLRALDIMGTRTRKYWADTFNSRILRGKDLMPIWNEKDGNKIATNEELSIMFTRAVTRIPSTSKLSLTRYQVAAILARDFIPNP